MKTLNRDDLLAKLKSANKSVHIESLDADILLRELPAGEVLHLTEQFNNKEISQEDFTFELIASSMIDEDGKKLLTVEEAKELPMAVLTEIIKAIAEYNNLDIEKAKDNLKKT